MNTSAQPDTLPEPAERLSPLQLLASLYFRPSRLFADITPLKAKPTFLIVAWIAGVAPAIDRLDVKMMRSDLPGRSVPAALVWMIGGWWYGVRLKWSGDANPDSFAARIVYIHQDLVVALPAVLSTVVQDVSARELSRRVGFGRGVEPACWSCSSSGPASRATRRCVLRSRSASGRRGSGF